MIFVTAHHPKLKKQFLKDFWFFRILKATPWCSNVRSYPGAEMSRKHFKSEEKSSKTWKNVLFSVLFIIERVFINGIHRKDKKVKTVFASIPIPNYAFSKNKKYNSLKPQVQCLMKTIRFLQHKKVFQCKNALKTIPEFLNYCVFLSKTHLQYYIRKFNKTRKNHEKSRKLSVWRIVRTLG